MLALPPSPQSLWTATSTAPPYAPLVADATADVCVVGAGITGLTAALAFAEQGASVIVLEAGQVGGGVTGHTTGKVSALHGLIYDELQKKWGSAATATYAQAQLDAIAHVRAKVETLEIDCDLRTKQCYTYVTSQADRSTIRDEVTAARAAGLDASFSLDTPLPYAVDSAISLPDQAEFHARKYLLGLAAGVTALGGRIAQQSMATGLLERKRPVVLVGEHRVTAGEVVIASHMPFLDRGAFFARLEAKRSYAIAVRTAGPIPEGMFISSGDGPTRSVRAHPDGDGGELLIIGGEGHVAGEHGDTTPERYERLAGFAEEHFAATEVTHRWSSQDLQPADGLPYVGRLTPVSLHTWVATGYRKWGLTAGTAAALALVERISGRPAELAVLLDAWRVTPIKSAVSLVRANAGTAGHMVADRLRRPESGTIEELAPGEGAIMRHDGQTVAASRDLTGTLHAVSPDCTHLGCRVLWNRAERSWDCPCHGSRFAGDGKVLEGPATRPLINRLDPDAA